MRSTAGEHVENVFDADSHPTNARTPATLTLVRGDPITARDVGSLRFRLSYHIEEHGEELESHSIPTSNQIVSWLKEMESLRKLLSEVSDSPLIVGKLSLNRSARG